MEAVAARAHSSKTTIYRRWPGKAELVVDALNGLKGAMRCLIRDRFDTTSKRSPRTPGARTAVRRATDDGFITALAHDAELRRVFGERFIEPHTATLKAVFLRAMGRGEVNPERDLEQLASLYPALMIRHLLTTGEIPGRTLPNR